MGFSRRNKKRYPRDDGYRKKRKLKTTIRLVGMIVVIIGFLVGLYDLKNQDSPAHQQYFLISIGLIVIGMAMILQGGLKKIFKTPCQCCKCTNCGRDHNHWTHD
jgi:hypothetical protein